MDAACAGAGVAVAVIRPAEFDDSARLGRVHVETWRATYRGLLSDDYLDALSDIRQAAFWSRVLDDADRAAGAHVAEDEDAGVVGFSDCGPERGGAPGWGEIMAIYILPEWQRQGLGRRLVGASGAHLAARGSNRWRSGRWRTIPRGRSTLRWAAPPPSSAGSTSAAPK